MAADVYNDSQSWQGGYHLHQLQGSKEYGSEKKGHLLKKSRGTWKVWQRRKCAVQNGTLIISHARSNRQPAELNLLTCQLKPNAKDKKSFDVISHNRTYHFKAEDEQDCIAWVSVLTNSKEEALTVFFRGEQSTGEESLDSLTNAIIENVQRLPGNDVCCDCGSSEPTWLSTNLGILICIECSGIHREMGVHISRIQSLELDKLGTSELLLAKNIGNNRFNDIMEANLPSSSLKPNPSSDVTVRKEYIMAKYIDHRFARKTCSSSSAKLSELLEAIRSRDLLALIQAYAEGVELMEPLLDPGQELGETALHHAIRTADRTSLHLVYFLIQNSGNLNKQTALGNTVLHYCSMYGKPQCLKLLLRRKPMVDVVNQAGETALDIAKRLKATQCEDLLSQAKAGKFNPHVHVEYEWNLQRENMDESNEELDNKQSPIKKEHSPRPQSCGPSSSTSPQDKLSLLGFSTPGEKQQLSDGTFTSQVSTSTSADLPTSPTSDVPPQRNARNSFGPEFMKMTFERFISLNLDLPQAKLSNKGKNEENQRKLNIMLLSGQRLELTCHTKTVCKDVFDTVVAHIGLVEHHLFALATLKDNEYFFVDPELKLTKVAPEGWKEERKKKNIATVNFTLFFRIQFFVDDVSLIQYSLTCHQYYLQLRKDILEERMSCDDDTSLLLASLALQAEYGDYSPEVHGVSYFRLEHYLPPRLMEKLDLSYIKEALPKLHNTYVGASEKDSELEFVKVCQRVTEYGVHLHRVRPEKKSQPGIVLGVCSKGVLVFEVHSGVRTLLLRSPWIDTKQISVSKKKFTLQNISDGIKHAFQTDNAKVCRYLLHLCPSQLKFDLQMRARQRNRDAQETVPSTPVRIADGMKNDMQKPSYVEESAIDSSEDHRWPRGTPSHSSESSLGLSGALREGSLSSQVSRAESASWSQRQVSGFFASPVGDRTCQESQHGSPSSPCAISKASEKKRASDSNQSKAKKPGISDATDSSDRGDSDVDEAPSSSSPDHQTPEKESSSSMNTSNKMNFKTFPSSPPKPGDNFEVELAKNDDSLGISVTNSFGPEFVKMTMEPFISLDLPQAKLSNKGRNEENRRKLNIMLLSGRRLELTCDTKTICKDVFDTVVAHIGLLEHHLFALATLKDNEYFFVDPELKLTKVAPEGWKEERKKKNIATVNFTLFFRIQFFVDDVSLIQYSLTCHQYYLQLRKDILEERMSCDDDTSLLLASLALQAEYGDYSPEVHGVSYFRLEHYLPPRLMEKLDLSYIKEALPKLHNTYVGASEKDTELEFVKVCQRVTEYGVHLHRVRPEKKSQPGIVLGVCSKGVLVFEVHSGVRTLLLRSPWIDTKQISVSKKKFTLQNISDGIKHAFQTDNAKVCRYLLHLCPSQLKFDLQMRARQRNRDAQETVPSTPVRIADGMKNDMQKPSYVQDSAIDSSEDHRWPRGTPSHSSESSLGLSGALREGSLSSQVSRAESASWSQRQVSGFFASPVGDRTCQESQHGSPSSPCAISKASEKKRASDSNQSKAKKPGISDATDSSDRGDSDVDEATSSSSPDHQTPEKESSSSMNTSNKMNFKTFPSSPPKPGDNFEVELAKNDDSLGISVTNSFGPEFVKMTMEPFISLDLPQAKLSNKGRNEENRRKLNIMLLSGQRLELTCDTKTICKDVFDTVVAHIGLLEHHLFALATLKDNEYFFVDPELKLTKVAPEGWKEERKKKNIATVNFTLFFRIQFFVDDVSLIQYSLTCHQYYLQLRKDILEERMSCDDDTSLLLASLALQAEYGDYSPEVHGVSYFRLEHYLPPRLMEKLDLSYIKEALPILHNTYVGASEKDSELEFVKVCQRVTEYGVHLHRVRPEKKSQPGIVLGVCSKGVLVFEVHSGVRTLLLRSPWIDTKQISVSKKKFTLQNISDGIKHAFQTDNAKVCRYLLHLCPSQLKFDLQMRARQRNRDAQETVPSTPVRIADGMKNDMQKPSYVQDSAIDSSEDHRWPRGTPSHRSESSLGLSGGRHEGSLSSQVSRAESASWSQRQVSGFFASPVGDRTCQESQHGSPSSPCAISKASEKKRASDSNQSKAKKPGISDATDSSDRGDSDVDEATSSSSPDHQTPEKESSSSMNTSNKMNFKTFPSSPPKPGDNFEVELAKNDDSLGISVTNSFGPEFVKMTMEPFISLDLPQAKLSNKGRNEENRRKLNIMLLSGRRLELTCDTKTICKDVFDTVVAHIGLLEHHLFALATLKDNEYFFVDPELKLTKVAPEGWKEERKKKNIATVNFTLFFRIQFFVDDVSLIQYSLTCHQYYLQLRKDILEERMSCDDDTSLLLASLALQAEYGDYSPEVHGVSYFRLEHYLPPRLMEKLDLSYIKEALPILHNTYVGASEKDSELEFVKVCQRVTEYGVHLHRVRPEKKSQPGIVLGVCSKGVLVFEVHSGVRTLLLRSPWIDTKQISVSKKKFTLQNISDGIKHAFQTDNAKVCRYLLHLCPSQLKFDLQMRARQRNRDAQETVPSTPVRIADGMKNDMQKPSYVQDSAIDSSEDHRWPRGTPSHSSESSLGLSGGRHEGSLSSQVSRAESASWSQRQVSGFFASPVGDRTCQESQHGSPSSPCAISKASEKKRASDSNQSKAKKPGISDATDSSDRGDSDVDEAPSSSSPDHQTPEKESSSSMNTSNKMNFKTFPSSPPKPGDNFEVELAKNDDSLGISVTNSFGPEFVKMTMEPFISLDLPQAKLSNKGRNEENRRKLNIMLLSGRRLELTCDTKTICKDVFDTVVAHIGLLEHHLFALATLKDNEYFFVDPELKLTKVAPEGWKEERKKKNIATVNFTLFFRIQFFVDDVSLIQYSLTCHQYYLQLRKDILEERMSCDDDTSLLLASLALQAEYGDYSPEVHGVSYFRLEHYLPPRLMEKLDLSYIKEALPKLHNTYVGASEKDTELEFVKVCQRVTGYGVHLHRVRPEKKSQPGIVLGVCSKGVLVFEVHSGVRTLLLRSPWIDTKQISVSKKKFTLQNISDGIKHAFHTDNAKVCRYLLHLCPSQLKFDLQMRARQRNRDAQETGDCVLAVNGVNLKGATQKQAVETVRNTRQLVHLLLEKGQSPASSGPVPITPQCTLLEPDAQGEGPEKMMKKMTSVKDYSFVTEENTFEVKLFKNSSVLGFSFTREENLLNTGIVMVKKLLPGQPAAESGKIDVGDVILKVNGVSLKGLSQQEVISALRTPPEVSLLLCRPPPGVLPEMDPALLTPLHSPAQELPNSSEDTSQPACVEPGTSSDENKMSDKSKKPCTSPPWRDSCSDSSGSGEEDVVKAAARISKSDVQEDDFHDDPQEAEFIQSLLDVLDEEAQNLKSKIMRQEMPLFRVEPEQISALKTNARISEETAEDTDCDGSLLPEDFTESTKMNGYEEYCEEKVTSESLIQKSQGRKTDDDEITWRSDELPIETTNHEDSNKDKNFSIHFSIKNNG